MTYATDQASVQGSADREIYDFTIAGGAYRFTSYAQDVSYGGLTYAAIPISRNNITQTNSSQSKEVLVTLPADHAIVGLLINSGIPPRKTGLVITSIEASGAALQIWSGRINGISTQDEWAQLRVPNRYADIFAIKLPIWKAQRLCNNQLYGPRCQVSRAGGRHNGIGVTIWVGAGQPHVILPNVVSAIGTTVIVDSISAKPNGWANGGEIQLADGSDSRTVLTQVGTTLTLDMAFSPQLTVGAPVNVWQGCDWTIETCHDDFDNVRHFAGAPRAPTSNVFSVFGVGWRSR